MAYKSAGAEEYLEAIYQLVELGREATTSGLAEWLEVAPSSVSDMMRRLGKQGLVHHQPYRPISLTEIGCKQASRLLRRQRLWEVFLFEHLQVPLHQVFEEACKLEHGTTPLIESHLERFLEHPAFCPHGFPISEVGDHIPVLAGVPLSSLEPGQKSLVRRLPERHSEILKYLESQGVMPGIPLAVLDQAPFDGPMTVRLESQSISLGAHLAGLIVVDPISEQEQSPAPSEQNAG
jgi:DtxR family Mn-dependent transcriptional regulator